MNHSKLFPLRFSIEGTILILLGNILIFLKQWVLGIPVLYIAIPFFISDSYKESKLLKIYLLPCYLLVKPLEYKSPRKIFSYAVILVLSSILFLCVFLFIVMILIQNIDTEPNTVFNIMLFMSYAFLFGWLFISTSKKTVLFFNKHILSSLENCKVSELRQCVFYLYFFLLIISTCIYCFFPLSSYSVYIGPKIVIGAFATYLAYDKCRRIETEE